MRCSISGSRVLVTGGAGFIGSHLVDDLILRGAKCITILDNLFTGKPANLEAAIKNGTTELFVGTAEDSTLVESLIRSRKIDIVFNCATKPLNHSFTDPPDAFHVNTLTTASLLEALRKKHYQTLCHLSSSEVYGTARVFPMDESHPLGPTTTYAAGKAAADMLVESYVKMFDLDAFIVRPFNNFGPRQNSVGPLAGVIPRTIAAILTGNAPEIHGTGEQTRDFVYVKDTVQAILELYTVTSRGESVNISARNQITIRRLIELIAQEMGYQGKFDSEPGRPADVEHHCGSSAKLEKLAKISWTPFPTALRQTVDWYRQALEKQAA